ncbi:ricin-type beta-trefoil lectin domain protein [Streptomyces sp. NPDC049040]|uniref:ricin-type beta-trefoil lectin domain protein n=1 Tax=Streptomyces sp. NPDC049040 TaxID=3365593 RepID=UPI0037148CA9
MASSDSAATIIANAANVVPSSRQLAWERLEETAFLHFGVNTFDGREWGTGTENPSIFQPTGLNTDQWAASLKAGGFKEAILTAKHHDGFLLFPSAYSSFGVASSSWLGGQGDVIKNFTASMHKYGLKVGLYLSPADIHENLSGGRYANGSATKAVTIPSDSSEIVNGVSFHFNSDDYNTYYENTLYELLSRYGSVDELWWDNANPTGRSQPYNFSDWIKIVRTLQPNAVIENDGGPDVRWVGNENGYARTSEWSVVPFTGNAATAADTIIDPPGGYAASDLGSDSLLSQRKSDGTSAWNLLRWSPAECNTTLSANHNWFWHPGDPLRGEAELEDLYYGSVGRNCNQLLDIGPDQQGLIDAPAVTALSQYGTAISSTFATNLAAGAGVANDSGTANATGHTPGLALDGNLNTSWQSTGSTGALVFTLPSSRTFDVISVQEDLNTGQHVKSYAVDAWNGSSWNQVASDTTIGQKKLIRLASPTTTTQVRLRITGSRATPSIAEFGLFRRPAGSASSGTITSASSGRCVDVNGKSTTNGTQLQLWDCNGGSNQKWTHTSGKALSVYGNKCLDASGQGTSPGTAVVIWDCNGQTNQQWNINSNGTITGAQSGLCLDAYGAGTANGTKLDLWTCNGGSNQRWSLN